MAPTAPAPAPLLEASAPAHGPDHTAHGTARDPLFADLLALANDLWWTGRPAAHDLWPRLDPVRWEALNHNPLAMLREGALAHASPAWREDAEALLTLWRAYHRRPQPKGPLTAYFCMEYGLHESLPIYSGGLGMLAGDHLRSACDTDLNLVAVGIFWSEGYFRQVLHDGRQMPAFCRNDPARLPIKPVLGPDGRPVVVRVPLGAGTLAARAHEVHIGRVRLLLLDADVPENPPEHRALTQRLYGGDQRTRLIQEVLLGIGGARLLRAIGLEPATFHMNEGHASFLTLELWARGVLSGLEPEAAWAAVRQRCVFTTHTPVPAGHDRFPWALVDPVLGAWRSQIGLWPGAFMDKGRERPGDVDEPLCMTVLGMRASRAINGVSALHGEVTREMWRGLKLPVGHITNGVHPGAWLAPETMDLWDRHLPDWRLHLADRGYWQRCHQLPQAEVLAARDQRRARLVAEVRRRLGRPVLDPRALTIGFARRFAPYKRGDLLFFDPDRLVRLLDAGVQVLYSGKAHPADVAGQQIVARVLEFVRDPRYHDRVLFVPDYDMALGRLLTSGCDVWLNTPRRPREASGTSGQKAAINGNLNCSIQDGWWPEAWDGSNGWSIGRAEDYADEEDQDVADAGDLYRVLEEQVLPTFADGPAWAKMSAASMASCVPLFNTHRMVLDYKASMYEAELDAPAPALPLLAASAG
jgi:starch phosphorylase